MRIEKKDAKKIKKFAVKYCNLLMLWETDYHYHQGYMCHQSLGC